MYKSKLIEKLENYKKALNRLKESVEETNVNQYVYDSVIQRFEFTYELSWKLLKSFFEYNGLEDVKFPKEAFKEAFSAKLIDEKDMDIWIEIMKARNITSHTYDEEDAQEIYNKIKNIYYERIKKLSETLEREIQK